LLNEFSDLFFANVHTIFCNYFLVSSIRNKQNQDGAMNQYYRKQRRLPEGHHHFFNRTFVMIILLVTIFALAHLWQRSNVRQMLIEISQLQKRMDSLIQENRQLQAKMFELSTNERLRDIAKLRFDMIDPGNPPKIVLYPSKDEKDNLIDSKLAHIIIDSENLAYLNPITLAENVEK